MNVTTALLQRVADAVRTSAQLTPITINDAAGDWHALRTIADTTRKSVAALDSLLTACAEHPEKLAAADAPTVERLHTYRNNLDASARDAERRARTAFTQHDEATR